MTKKEKLEFEDAINRANMLAALRWTAPVSRDVLAPTSTKTAHSTGWDFNSFSGRVIQSWSGFGSHGTGCEPGTCSASQGAINLFSTRARALAAMRHELELKYAKSLLLIDQQIAELLK